jgi:hypothetical protein
VASDIPDFHQLAEEEGLAIDFVPLSGSQALARHIVDLLRNPERQMEMGLQNVSAALRMSMPEIMRQYLRGFRLQKGLGELTAMSRLRRLPRWLPLRDTMVRFAGKKVLQRPSPAASVGKVRVVTNPQKEKGSTIYSTIEKLPLKVKDSERAG